MKGLNIRSRMVLWFGLIFILGLMAIQTVMVFGLPWMGVTGKLEDQRRQAYWTLSLVADIKKQQILDRFQWITEELDFFVGVSQLHRAVDWVLNHGAGEGEETVLLRHLMYGIPRQLEVVRRAVLVDLKEGRDVLATGKPVFYGHLRPFHIGRMTEKPYISEVLLVDGVPVFYFTQPVRGMEGEVAALLLVEVGLEPFLQPLLSTGTTLGKSGEILLVNQQNYQLSPLLHPLSDGQRAVPMVYHNQGRPANLASRGLEGVVDAKDYRGTQVLAAYRHLRLNSQWGWGLVAKMDKAEVFEDLLQDLQQMAWLLLGWMVVTSGVIFFLAGRLAAPLLHVGQVAAAFAAGNFSLRTKVRRRDEIGLLAQTFNAMADRIATMIGQIQSRGQELEEKNQDLRVQKAIQEKIVAITNVLATAESLDILLRTGGDALLRVTGSQALALYLRVGEEEVLQLHLALGWKEGRLGQRVLIGQGLVGLAALHQEMDMVRHLPDALVLDGQVAGEIPLRQLLLVPLWLHTRLVGVLQLGSFQEMDGAVREVMEVCRHPLTIAIVNTLAHADKARLAEDLKHKNDTLEQVNLELRQQSQLLREQRVELEQQQQQLKEANRLKSEFLSHMSHELRTPLNSILALSQLMVQKGLGHDLAQEGNFLAIIERNGRNLLGLINDILDLSRIEAGAMEVKIHPFQPQSVLQRCYDTMRPLAEAKQLALVLREGSNLWMKGDSDKVERILLNFISNAIKFTDQGQITLTMVFQGHWVRFAVEDSGIGIPAELMPRIFDPFAQVGSEEQRHKQGSGLGLTICRRLATLLGGEIQVTSTPGMGSLFQLLLPGGMNGDPVEGEIFPVVTLRGKQALLVDDQNLALMQLSEVLSEEGCEVTAVSSGREALNLLTPGWSPQVAVLDLMMPGVSGFELLEQIRLLPHTATLPVVILTAKALTPEEWGRLKNNHVQELVTKGQVNRQELLHKIRLAMGAPSRQPPEQGGGG